MGVYIAIKINLERKKKMSSEKIVIVGANHAGLAVARNLIDSGKEFEITMIDKSDDLGYLSCGTPLLLGNEVNSYRNFFYTQFVKLS